MVQVDETTQGVLNQISEGFEQKGAYNLRQNGIPLCHGDSELSLIHISEPTRPY